MAAKLLLLESACGELVLAEVSVVGALAYFGPSLRSSSFVNTGALDGEPGSLRFQAPSRRWSEPIGPH